MAIRLPGKELHNEDVFPTKSGGEKLAKQSAKEYVLWEVTHTSNGGF